MSYFRLGAGRLLPTHLIDFSTSKSASIVANNEFFGPASSPAVVVNDATHGHTSTAPTLTVKSVVSPDSATHDHTVTPPSLTVLAPITFVGSTSFAYNGAGEPTVAFSGLLNEAGTTPTLQVGDLVVVALTHAGTVSRSTVELTPTGYTAVGPTISSVDTNVVSHCVSYKRLTAIDTLVTLPAVATPTNNGMAGTIHVFRNIDAATPVAATASAAGINGGNPNPPAVTPTLSGAWIYVSAGGASSAATDFAAPADLSTTTNHFRFAKRAQAVNDPTIGSGIKTNWTSGLFDPVAWTGNDTAITASWAAQTLVLKRSVTVTAGVSDASHDHTATEPVITATPIPVVVTDSTVHAHTATSPTLVLKSTVAPNNSDHGHTATSSTLVLKSSVTPNNSTHAHTATAPTVTASGTPSVVVNSATHGHTSTGPTLVLKSFVTPANDNHAHTATSPTLVVKSNVVPISSAHGHTSTSPAISVPISVGIDDTTHELRSTSSVVVFTPYVVSPPDPVRFKKRGTPINAYKQFKTLRSFRSR